MKKLLLLIVIILVYGVGYTGFVFFQDKKAQNNDIAEYLIKKAEQGDAEAQALLGRMYSMGNIITHSYTEAVKWYWEAAKQGNASAQYNLGGMYEEGDGGLAKDPVEAAKWYRKAAEQGHARAQNNLASLYSAGQGVPQNHAEAIKWYIKSAEQGNAKARENLSLFYDIGSDKTQHNFPEIVKYYTNLAEKGDSLAQGELGFLYYHGSAVPKDYIQAYKWFSIAVNSGDARYIGNRDDAAKYLTPEQLIEAQRLVDERIKTKEKAK
jgi:uncharacterized protein